MSSENLIPVEESNNTDFDQDNSTLSLSESRTVYSFVNNNFINASNLTKYYLGNETFNGYVNESGLKFNETEFYENGDNYIPILLIDITRLSNGLSKRYNVLVDDTGYFEIPINLAPGTYKVNIPLWLNIGGPSSDIPLKSYTIFVLNRSINKTQTFLDYDYSIFEHFKGNNFTGTLKTENNKFLSNKSIYIQITRDTTGAQKTYIVNTNENGEFSLPINLAENGSYTFICTYDGNDGYESSMCKLSKYFR